MKWKLEIARKVLYALILFSLFTNPAFSLSQSKAQKIDALLKKCYENGQFNGSVLVAENGKVIYNEAFGIANPESKEKLKNNTAYNLASVTKQFTCMGIMLLKERGDLSYEDDIQKYIPELPYMGITIRNLMNHTSGLPDYIRLFSQKWDTTATEPAKKKIATNDDVIEMLKQYNLPLLFKPGEQWRYSNTGYIMLASIVARASGEEFDQFMKKNIFEPLKMENTLVYSKFKDQKMAHRAYGFRLSLDGSEHLLNDVGFLDGVAGDGAIYSTTEDLFKWDQALYAEKLIKGETLEEAFKPVTLKNDSTVYYGFGWGIDTTGNKIAVRHTGGWVGFRTIIVRELEDKNTVVLLSNNTVTPTTTISNAIRNILHNRDYAPPKISIAQVIGKTVLNSGIEEAIQQYHKLKTSHRDTYDFRENQLNRLSYQLLEIKKVKEAIEIFKLNVEAFPEAFNPYDSLGEAYMINGDKKLAIKNYAKSLTLNPDNATAIDMLYKIKGNNPKPGTN